MTARIGDSLQLPAKKAESTLLAPAKKPSPSPAKKAFDTSSISSMAPPSGAKENKIIKEEGKAVNTPNVDDIAHATGSTSFKELPEKPFFELFPISLDTHACTDDFCQSDEGHVVGAEIGDCVALFGRSDKTIFVSHLSAKTKVKEIVKELRDRLGKSPKETFLLYTFGGNGSPDSVQLLKDIHAAIDKYFGKKGKLVENFINPNASSKFKYVSAALDISGKLFFCRHDA